MKRTQITAAVCAALMLTAAVPFMPMMQETASISAHAEEVNEGEYSYIIYDVLNVTITKYNGTATEVVIPSTRSHRPVTAIGEYAFSRCKSLSTVTLPKSVASLGRGVFGGCTNLISVTIPESVTDIGAGAFYDTPWLTAQQAKDPRVVVNGILIDGTTCEGDVRLPDGATVIGRSAFLNCDSITSVTIPKGVTKIQSNAFAGCKGMSAVNIPEGVTEIGETAFYNCVSLWTLTLPDSVTAIGNAAFANCIALTKLTIPNGVTEIGVLTFSDCKKLASVTLPESLTSIGDHAFSHCTDLTSLTIPESVQSIGSSAFMGCPSLTLSVYPGSYGQTYAEANSIPYVLLDGDTPPTDSPAPSYGDIDEDGELSIMDVILINKSLLGGATLSPAAKTNADVDKSGAVDTTDALIVLKAVVKLVTLPV